MRSIIDVIWDWFRKPKMVPLPDGLHITGIQMGQILKPYCDNLWLSDSLYKLANKDAIESFLKVNQVDKRKYITEAHDCDDFGFELMGDVSTWDSDMAFGIVWGNRAGDGAPHAWNFFVDGNMKVWYVEPQNDTIFEPSTENIWIMIV